MLKSIVLISLCGLVLAHYSDDEEHQQLHKLAADIMQNLQKDHMPGEGSNSGAPNAPIHHLHNIGKNAMNSDFIQKTDKLKVSVGVKGIKFVSVEANGKVVNISTGFGVGAVALYSVQTDDNHLMRYYNSATEVDTEAEIDDSLDKLSDEYLVEIPENAGKNQTKVILAQKAKFGMKIEPKSKGKKTVNVTVDHGYVVGAIVNVTSGRKFN